MKIKNVITLEQLKEAYVEEYRAVVAERIHKYFQQGGEINEGFLDKVKGGAKGFLKGYGKLLKGYGDFAASLYGYSPDDEKAQAELPPEVQPPDEDEMLQALRDQDAAEVDDLMVRIQQQIDAMRAKAAGTGKEGNLDSLEDYADKMETAVGGDESVGQKTPDSDAVLDMIDKVQDEWDSVEKKTQDKKLKKAMDYIEKVAVAEKKLKVGRKTNG